MVNRPPLLGRSNTLQVRTLIRFLFFPEVYGPPWKEVTKEEDDTVPPYLHTIHLIFSLSMWFPLHSHTGQLPLSVPWLQVDFEIKEQKMMQLKPIVYTYKFPLIKAPQKWEEFSLLRRGKWPGKEFKVWTSGNFTSKQLNVVWYYAFINIDFRSQGTDHCDAFSLKMDCIIIKKALNHIDERTCFSKQALKC